MNGKLYTWTLETLHGARLGGGTCPTWRAAYDAGLALRVTLGVEAGTVITVSDET